MASLGATGYELDVSSIGDTEKKEIIAQIDAYKQIDELIRKGDLYRLSDPYTSKRFCVMVVSKDKTRAYIVCENLLGIPHDIFAERLRLDGLADDKLYRIEETGLSVRGSALKNIGVPIPHLSDFGAFAWHISEIEKENDA